jgi:hypothetical protein
MEEIVKYMLLICGDDTAELSPADSAFMETATKAWVDEMDGRGVRVAGNRLRPVADATTVRVRDGEVLLSDGPFAETKEQIGGFDLIECENLDEAIAVAAKHPVAAFWSIEVRPLWPD